MDKDKEPEIIIVVFTEPDHSLLDQLLTQLKNYEPKNALERFIKWLLL